MKILIFGHPFEVGGTQVNAIELAAGLQRAHRHQAVFFATPGPMVEVALEKGLRFIPAPDARVHPSPARMRALCSVMRRERPDLLHVWDWPQCLDAYYPAHLLMRAPMIVSHMSMEVDRFLPKALPITFGTPELTDRARASGWRRAQLLVPPVDVFSNAPEAVDSQPFREQYAIGKDEIVLVTVSRLSASMKSESLYRTVNAVFRLGDALPLRFLIVGDGDARAVLERIAGEVNRRLHRPAIVLTGMLLDPRPAYAAADIVIGMGGSALRGMAFAKPVIVVGERGFVTPLTPKTAESLYYRGLYGTGNGDPGNARIAAAIGELAGRREEWPAIGEFAREFVVEHYGLETVTANFADYCRMAVEEGPRFGVALADGVRTAALLAAGKLYRAL